MSWEGPDPARDEDRLEEIPKLSTARVGHLSELRAIEELITRGHEVAVPVVDDIGVDLVVNYGITVQVKASSSPPPSLHTSYIFNLSQGKYNARGERYFIHRSLPDVLMCHARDIDLWWILTREQIEQYGSLHQIKLSPNPDNAKKYGELYRVTREAWHVFDSIGGRRAA